jgi:hypothetical protein
MRTESSTPAFNQHIREDVKAIDNYLHRRNEAEE